MMQNAGLLDHDMSRFFVYHRTDETSLCPWLMTHLEQLGSFTYDPTLPYDPEEPTSDSDGDLSEYPGNQAHPPGDRPSDAMGDTSAEGFGSEPEGQDTEESTAAEEPAPEPSAAPIVPVVVPMVVEPAEPLCELPLGAGSDHQIIFDWKDTSKTSLRSSILTSRDDSWQFRVGPWQNSAGLFAPSGKFHPS